MATAWLPLASVTLRGSIVAVVSASATLPSASPAPRLRGGVRPHGAAFPAQGLHDAFGLGRNHIRSMADRRHRPRDPVSHRSVGHLHRPDPGPRAQVRVFVLAAALATMLVVPAAGQQAAPLPFEEWRAGLMAEARARGFSDALVNEALAGVEPCEQVISEDRNQAEVVQTLEQYYRIRVSPTMVERGRALARASMRHCSRGSKPSTASRAGSSWPFGAWNRSSAGSPAVCRSSRRWRHWLGTRGGRSSFGARSLLRSASWPTATSPWQA